MQSLINELFQEIDLDKHKSCDVKSEGAADCPDCLGIQYNESSHDIDYTCEQKRKIYILRYMPVHVKEIEKAIALTPKSFWDKVKDKEKVRILSIGGGMGVDGLAFLRVFKHKRNMSIKEIVIGIIDKQEGWLPLAKKNIGKKKKEVNFKVLIQRKICDITEKVEKKYAKFDFVSISYVVSELRDEDMQVLASNIKHFAKKDIVLIINDRNQSAVKERIKILKSELASLSLNISAKEESDQEHCGVFYDDTVRDLIKPKLKTNSIRYNIRLEKQDDN